jgi:hypothetical protein
LQHPIGVPGDLSPGEAHDGEARAGEALVAQPVVLEGPAGGVNVSAVGLEDEALGAPEKVGLVGDAVLERDPRIDRRGRQRGVSTET